MILRQNLAHIEFIVSISSQKMKLIDLNKREEFDTYQSVHQHKCLKAPTTTDFNMNTLTLEPVSTITSNSYSWDPNNSGMM